MSWFLRFAGLASLLAPLCWLLSKPYQVALAAAVSSVLPLFGQRLDLGRVDVAAPFDLGLFVALCLATRRPRRGVRARALLTGIPVLMLVEVLGVAASIAIMLRFRGRPGEDTAMRAGFYLTDTIPWVSAGLAWLWLMDPWEMPRPRGALAAKATPQRRDP